MSQPNKALGQHWLEDEASLQAVADAAGVEGSDTVLEIGPGPGTLTAVLVDRAEHVIAVEVDSALAKDLPANIPVDNLTVIEGDIRYADFSDLPKSYKVAANIPYYLTSYIVQLLLAANPKPSQIGLLMQKEVAERICAEPGGMSVLAVSTQLQAEVTLGPVVPKKLFYPAPKVDSQVISIKPKATAPENMEVIMRVVKAGFSERRKKLSNSLHGGLQIPKQEIEQVLIRCELELNARAQELSISDWENVTKELNL